MNLAQSLCLEHLESMSAVYDQMVWLKKNDLLPWPDFKRRDMLLEAHVDGLVVGGKDALSLCREKMLKGDDGECYGAVRVFIRQNKYDALKEILYRMDLTDEDRFDSVARAFFHETPDTCMRDMVKEGFAMKGGITKLSARIAGFHRFDMVDNLYDVIDHPDTPKDVLIDAIRSLGFLKPYWGPSRSEDLLKNNDHRLRNATLSALVRIGEPYTLGLCLKMPLDQWPGYDLGLTGKTPMLKEFSNGQEIPNNLIMAEGITGNIMAVPKLIPMLDHEHLSESAAFSLNLITGAGLTEDIFIPDDIDEDFLTYKEAEQLAQGIIPGKTVTRISRNPDHWRDWWGKVYSTFDPVHNYRFGNPISPMGLHLILASETLPAILRQMAADELSIRYRIETPFDPWMSIKTQRLLILTNLEQVQKAMGRFTDGVLYYKAKPVNEEETRVHYHQ